MVKRGLLIGVLCLFLSGCNTPLKSNNAGLVIDYIDLKTKKGGEDEYFLSDRRLLIIKNPKKLNIKSASLFLNTKQFHTKGFALGNAKEYVLSNSTFESKELGNYLLEAKVVVGKDTISIQKKYKLIVYK